MDDDAPGRIRLDDPSLPLRHAALPQADRPCGGRYSPSPHRDRLVVFAKPRDRLGRQLAGQHAATGGAPHDCHASIVPAAVLYLDADRAAVPAVWDADHTSCRLFARSWDGRRDGHLDMVEKPHKQAGSDNDLGCVHRVVELHLPVRRRVAEQPERA
jgi:hypothetical protein